MEDAPDAYLARVKAEGEEREGQFLVKFSIRNGLEADILFAVNLFKLCCSLYKTIT